MLEINKIPVNNQTSSEKHEIPRIVNEQLTYEQFFQQFMHTNQPVIITGTSTDWECARNWIQMRDATSKINFEYLWNEIPNVNVPVADCSKKFSNSHEKTEMNFREFLTYWQSKSSHNSHELYYLKDWHLRNIMPNYEFYKVPPFFGSDWLNEWLIETGQDDYRFVYMGPQGTWTPFHADVFNSFSWSTNIIGRKKWIFLLPKEELKLLDKFGNTPFSVDEKYLIENHVLHHVIVQHPNESIFVPSGWYHQVWNLDDTISVNHNWFNGCNVHEIWRVLFDNYLKVCKEIEDCRDMDNFDEHCQIMLKASHGINFKDFLSMLNSIAVNRQRLLHNSKSNSVDKNTINEFEYGKNHIEFDMKVIEDVCREIVDKCLNLSEIGCNIVNVCSSIQKIISEFT